VTLHTPGLPEEEQCAPFLALGEGVALAAGKAIERRVGEDEGEFKLSNRSAKVLEGNGRSRCNLRERLAKELPIVVDGVQPAQHFVAYVVVVTGEVKSGHLNSLRRWDERLGHEQVRQVGEGKFLGRWKLEAGAVVERVAGERGEARVPHQRGIQRRIDGKWRPALVARACPMGADDAVVVNADRYRLRITEAVRRRVATAACVVVVQAANDVKPEQPAEIGQLPIDRTAQFVSKPGLDSSREAGCCEDLGQSAVQAMVGGVSTLLTLGLRSSLTRCPSRLPHQRDEADDHGQ
jgi:hypothetical protein